jgi:hypothetical protein
MATTTEPNARLKSDLAAAVRTADPRPAASLSFEPQRPALSSASITHVSTDLATCQRSRPAQLKFQNAYSIVPCLRRRWHQEWNAVSPK